MSRHIILIIKDTHRGLLYEDGVFREVLAAGRYHIPRPPSSLAAFFGAKAPRVEVLLVDVRGSDRTVVVQDLLTADGATISASFVVQYHVSDPLAAIHRVKSFEERLYGETQTAARRVLRGLSLEEVMGSRDEIGEELLRLVRESAPSYGLDVSGLDFKDLIVPGDFRKVMNRAVLAKRLRQTQVAEGRTTDDPVERDEEIPLGATEEIDPEDDPDLIAAKAAFGRERAIDPLLDGLVIRPYAQEPRGIGFPAGVLDVTLRRRCP